MSLLSNAADFLWKNARLLDRQRFALFLHDSASTRNAVITALRAYQNSDGGFGNAIEPDLRTPESQPQPVEIALHVLSETGPVPDLLERCCAYLQTITTAEGGVPFVLPSAAAYPAQPWWQSETNPPASLNPTAAIAGLLYQLGFSHPWLDGATDYCWKAIAAAPQAEVHELLCVLRFLEYVPERARAEAELGRIGSNLLVSGLVAIDPDATGYVKFPLDLAPSPSTWTRRLFDDTLIDQHLDALIARQQPDGGWPINWVALSPGSEMEWRGWVTVNALQTLKAYGRL